jgi:ankyrin repeat protein
MTKVDIFKIVEQGKYQLMKELVEQNPNLASVRNPSGYYLFHTVANLAPVEIVEWLIDLGADVNAKDDDGQTPLFWALDGNIKAAEVLLAQGARLDISDRHGYFPIHRTAECGEIASLDFLLAQGIFVDQRSLRGSTALHIAAGSVNVETVKHLIAKGADINACDENSEIPLHYVIAANSIFTQGKLEIMEVLIVNGANINARSKTGETPWTCARVYSDNDFVELLRKYGQEG